jgi:hypothetical protein
MPNLIHQPSGKQSILDLINTNYGGLSLYRFLRGEVNIERVFTDRLRDTWIEAGHKSDLDGLTFSSLTDRPTKRVKIYTVEPQNQGRAGSVRFVLRCHSFINRSLNYSTRFKQCLLQSGVLYW